MKRILLRRINYNHLFVSGLHTARSGVCTAVHECSLLFHVLQTGKKNSQLSVVRSTALDFWNLR
jgi:hypothetical protein